MSVEMRKILDKFFLPCFYGICILGVVIAAFLFMNVKRQQKEALLAYEKNLNINGTNETMRLESSEEFSNEDLLYSSSDESIIKVDESGNLISVGEGSAVLTITTKDQKHTQALVVNVGPDAIKDYLEENPADNKETASTIPVDKSLPETKDDNVFKVKPTSVTLDNTDFTLNLNTNNKTAVIKATVLPKTATDKRITWSSSDSNIATVIDGVVTAKKPGTVTITATTSNDEVAATAKVTITKRVVIIIGASQVTRMADYKTSYSSQTATYKTGDGTLIYVNKSGSGIDYQTTDGFTQAKKKIEEYSLSKAETKFDIFFPLSGNTIKDFTCNDISTSNQNIINYAANYNNVIAELKNSGYNVQGYVVSMHPVKPTQATNNKTVTNENKNACKKGYRSNWKYFQFNKAMKSIVENNHTANLQYESLFIKIMETNNNKKNFSYKIIYNTTDGVHWDKDTTNTYVDMMLNYSGNL